MKASIQSRFDHLVTPFLANGIMPAGTYGEAKRSLRREINSRVAATDAINAVLAAPPPPIAPMEASLPRLISAPLGILQLPGVLLHKDWTLP
jgi:hypothetical protein